MADIKEAVRRLRLVTEETGAAAATAKLKELAAAQGGVAVASERSAKATQSVSRAWENMQKRLDPVYRAHQRATIDIAKAEDVVGAALAEGLTTRERAAEIVDMQTRKSLGLVDAMERQARAERFLAAEQAARVAQMAQASINQTLGVRTDFGGAERAAEIAAYGNELDRLRAKYNPLFAASMAYAGELDEINRAHAVGAISAAEQGAAIARLNDRYQQAAASGRMLEGVTRAAAARSRQLSFQLVDIGQALATAPTMGIYALQNLGFQIAQIGQLYMGEGGFTQAVKDSGRQIAVFAARFGPIAAAAGAAAAGIGILQGEINRTSKVTVTYGDTALAVFQTIGDGLYSLVQPAVEAISPWFASAWSAVVDITKTQINVMVGAYVGLNKAVGVIFKGLPAVIGEAAIGAANIVIGAFNNTVQGAAMLADRLIEMLNRIPGVDIGKIGTVSGFDKLSNRFSGAAADMAKNIREAFAGSSADYAGQAFDPVGAQAEKNARERLANTKEAIAAAKAYRDLIKNANDRIRQMSLEAETAGKTGIEAEALRFKMELLNDATDKGRTITAAQREQIAKLAEDYQRVAEAAARARLATQTAFDRDQLMRSSQDQQIASALQAAGLAVDLNSAEAAAIRFNLQLSDTRDLLTDIVGGGLSDLRNALADGKVTWEEFGQIGINVLNRISDRLIQMATDQLIASVLSSIFGGASYGSDPWAGLRTVSSARGNVFAGGTGLSAYSNSIVDRPTFFAFAKGVGLMGEAGAEAIMPLKRGPDGSLGVRASGANDNRPVSLNVNVYGANGGDDVEERAYRGSQRALAEYDRTLPSKVDRVARRVGSDPLAANTSW